MKHKYNRFYLYYQDPKEPRKESEHTQKGAPGECSGDKEADGDSPTEEYLKDVGESVAAMLDPLGNHSNI